MTERKHDGQPAAAPSPEAPPANAAMILASLAMTPDGALGLFRAHRLEQSALEVADLRRARELLGAISGALTSADPAGPRFIEQLWQALQDAEAARVTAGAARDEAPAKAGEPAPPEPLAAATAASSRAAPPPVGPAFPSRPAGPPRPAALPRPTAESRTGPAPVPTAAPAPAPLAAVPTATPAPAPLAAVPTATPAPAPLAGPSRPPLVPLRPGSGKAPSLRTSPWIAAVPPLAPTATAPGSSLGAAAAPPASPVRPPVAAPVAPPAAAAPAQASQPLAATLERLAALNRIRLDESAPATLGLDQEVLLSPALPFRTADGEPAPPEHSAPASESDELGPAGETITVATKSPFAEHTLPFHKPERPGAPSTVPKPTASTPQAVAAQPAAPARVDAPPEAALEAAPAPRESTQGVTALASHLATMTVEQYAALCAECAVHPGWTAQIHARYQIQSEAERAALDGRWGERMAGNDELVRLWQWHYARFEQWFRQQGR